MVHVQCLIAGFSPSLTPQASHPVKIFIDTTNHKKKEEKHATARAMRVRFPSHPSFSFLPRKRSCSSDGGDALLPSTDDGPTPCEAATIVASGPPPDAAALGRGRGHARGWREGRVGQIQAAHKEPYRPEDDAFFSPDGNDPRCSVAVSQVNAAVPAAPSPCPSLRRSHIEICNGWQWWPTAPGRRRTGLAPPRLHPRRHELILNATIKVHLWHGSSLGTPGQRARGCGVPTGSTSKTSAYAPSRRQEAGSNGTCVATGGRGVSSMAAVMQRPTNGRPHCQPGSLCGDVVPRRS